MKDAISFDSLIEHQGEVVGGSFKFDRPAPLKSTTNKKATKTAKATPKAARSKAVASPQPPATPTTYKWERADEDYAAYAAPQPSYNPPAAMPAAPQPPASFYQGQTYAEDEDYHFAPGGIAQADDVEQLVAVRRGRPLFATLGVAIVAVAIALTGVSQLGNGGALLAGHGGFNVSAAGQVAPYLQAEQPQAAAEQPQAQPQAAANNPAQPHSIGDYHLQGAPSISVATIEKVLTQYGSPAVGNGQAFYDLGVKYGIDPAFMLAFYVHESGAGTQGAAVATKSVGNIICAGWNRCIGRFRAYDSYVQAAEDWYQLVTGPLYIGDGLDTPDKITPRYAPSTDNNDPNGYAKTVERLVDQWRSWQ